MQRPKRFERKKPKKFKKFIRHDTERNRRQQMYDSKWRQFRFRFLKKNPICFCCPEKATVVDHIEAHKGDDELFKKVDNFMPLCKQCHDFITGSFDNKKIQDLKGKMKWVKKMREAYNKSGSIKVCKYD